MKITIVITSNTDFEEYQKINRSTGESSNTLFELRLDKDQSLINLLTQNQIPSEQVILTLRSTLEGGNAKSKISKEQLDYWLSLKPGFVDLEIDRDADLLEELKKLQVSSPRRDLITKFILSKHVFNHSMTRDLEKSIVRFDKSIGDIVNLLQSDLIIFKFVSNCKDTIDMINSIDHVKNKTTNHILLGSDFRSYITRTNGKKIGNYLVYGSINNNLNIPSFQEIERLNNKNSLNLGLIGSSLTHSLSPQLHHTFLDSLDINGFYHKLEIHNLDDLPKLLKFLNKLGFLGINITFPYKQEIIKFDVKLSSTVAEIGVANTLKFENKLMKLENTDVSGFGYFWKNNNLQKFSNILIFGTGGASRAVIKSLEAQDYNILVIGRNKANYDLYPKSLKKHTKFQKLQDYNQNDQDDKFNPELIINATPIGMKGEKLDEFIQLPKTLTVLIDLAYSKNKMPSERWASNTGIKYFDGKEMLFHQAIDAFEFWTNSMLDRKKLFHKFNEGYF